MSTTCHVPITVRIVGEVSGDRLAELATEVERAVAARLVDADRELGRVAGRRRVVVATAEPAEPVVDDHLSAGGTYLVPSFDGRGRPVAVGVAGQAAGPTVGPPDRMAVLRAVHDILHPGLFHGIGTADAQRALRLLQRLAPLDLLEVVGLMRLTGDLRSLAEHLAPRDGPELDRLLLRTSPAVGFIVAGDLLRLRFTARGVEQAELGGDFAVDARGLIRPFLVPQAIPVAGLTPEAAANAIAKAYLDANLYWDLTVTLAPIRRGGAYGGVTPPSPIEVRSTVTVDRAVLARRQKFAEFVDYIRPVRASDDFTITALLQYQRQIDEALDRWKTPAELWEWALKQGQQASPVSPLRPYLDLQKSMAAQAVAAPPEERARIGRALADYVAWLSDHAADPRLGGTDKVYDPVEVYTRFYLRAYKVDLARSVAAAQRLRLGQLEAAQWERVGPTLTAAFEFLGRTVWRAAEPRSADDQKHLTSYLYYPSAAELIIRDKIGRDYLDDLMARAGTASLPAADRIATDFSQWIAARPDLRTALVLTASHPDVETFKIDIPTWQIATEVIVGFIPIIGQVVGGVEVLSGEDLFGHELSTTERGIIGVTLLLPFISKLYKVGKGVIAAEEMVKLYGLSSREAAYTYRFALKLGPGSAGARLFSSAAADIRAGRKVSDPRVIREMETLLKDMGMSDKDAVRALAERPASPLKGVTPEVEADVERSFAATFGSHQPTGLFQTTQRLIRGNLGERLAADALAHDGHIIISYKPSILGTNQGGIDLVTYRNGILYLVDNKALTRAGNVSSVSALTTNLAQNTAAVSADLTAMLADASRSVAERQVLQDALQALNQGRVVKAVTNANVARGTQILTGVTSNLSNQGIQFINVFP